MSDEQRRTLIVVIATGSTKAAAKKLGVPHGTVKSRLARLYDRIGVSNIAQAAYALGLEEKKRPS